MSGPTPTPNQEFRADLRALGECRDCEAPLLASEANFSRCGPCRAKRNGKEGGTPGRLAGGHRSGA